MPRTITLPFPMTWPRTIPLPRGNANKDSTIIAKRMPPTIPSVLGYIPPLRVQGFGFRVWGYLERFRRSCGRSLGFPAREGLGLRD